MNKQPIIKCFKQLGRPVFTTYELAAMSGRSSSAVNQGLNFLARQGLIFKIYRGIWGEKGNKSLSPYAVIPFLLRRQRAYVSFITALHLHGIIEQIPKIITLASLSHSRIVHTALATFSLHQISPFFFDGFNWYGKSEVFLIAEPEKALIDSLYLSTRRKKQFGYFPELHFSSSFSFRKAENWAKKIPYAKVRISVEKKLTKLKKQYHPYLH